MHLRQESHADREWNGISTAGFSSSLAMGSHGSVMVAWNLRLRLPSGGDMPMGPGASDHSFKQKHAVDIGSSAQAALCPADHSETSLSDYIASSNRLQRRTEVLNRVVDAETFPSTDQSRPQTIEDIKPGQASLVFYLDAAKARRRL